MRQENSFDFEKGLMPYDDFERIVRQARAARDAAIGRALRSACLIVMSGPRRFAGSVEMAHELRTLTKLSDRHLAMRGLLRGDLPALVYGWSRLPPVQRTQDMPNNDKGFVPVGSDRIAA